MKKVNPVIMCGGLGKRLWPLSTKEIPKPFINFQESSLFTKTLERFYIDNITYNTPLVITNELNRFQAKYQNIINKIEETSIILEPSIKNTLPAIILSALSLIELGHDSEPMIIASADHYIPDPDNFNATIKMAIKDIRENDLIIFGKRPTSATTQYGYFSGDNKLNNEKFSVKEFFEKPDESKAKIYKKNGYFWNTGIFLMFPRALINATKMLDKNLYKLCCKAWEHKKIDGVFLRPNEKFFNKIDPISIDNGLLENHKKLKNLKLKALALSCEWSDVGDIKNFLQFNTSNSADTLTNFKGKLYSNSKKNQLNKSMALFNNETLFLSNTKNIDEDIVSFKEKITDEIISTTIYRKWGFFEILSESKKFKIKKITIFPGQSISLQVHQKRNEHWNFISGVGKVICGDMTKKVTTNDQVFIPKKIIHKLTNISTYELLVFVEIQTGEYFGEDDIERI